jgi:hypothetical protein
MPSAARPSSIGEILDRAIATYIRRFLALFVILAVIAVPIAIVQALAQPGAAHGSDLLTQFTQMMKLPPGDQAGRARILAEMQRNGVAPSGSVLLLYLVQFLLVPLANTALIVFVAHTVDGVAVSIGSAYRTALARWIPQLAVGVGFFGIAIVIGVAVFIAAVIAGLAIGGVALFSKAAAVVIGVIVVGAFLLAMIGLIALGNVAWLMATVSVAIEDPNPVRAIGRGLRRTLDRPLRKRTLGAALAVIALDWFGTLAVLGGGGALLLLVHQELLYDVIAACGGIVIGGLSTVFILFYMRDVQLRREGSDLLLAASASPLPE